MPAPDPLPLLILGGTAEAAALAAAVPARFGGRVRVITSLAGRTRQPAPVPGELRVGGFGGASGLAAYLAAERIAVVIDATHPFAAQISAQAHEACAAVGVQRLLLHRPPWQRHARDRWIEVADTAAAAAALPGLGRSVWITIGARELDAFAVLSGYRFLVRLVEPPSKPLLLADCEVLLGRGPFSLEAERRIIARHGIGVLVAKAAGGAATEAKLVAARERGLPVVMVRRPPPPPGPRVDGVSAALDWLGTSLPGLRGETGP